MAGPMAFDPHAPLTVNLAQLCGQLAELDRWYRSLPRKDVEQRLHALYHDAAALRRWVTEGDSPPLPFDDY